MFCLFFLKRILAFSGIRSENGADRKPIAM
jgi:hypothetical protein